MNSAAAEAIPMPDQQDEATLFQQAFEGDTYSVFELQRRGVIGKTRVKNMLAMCRRIARAA